MLSFKSLLRHISVKNKTNKFFAFHVGDELVFMVN